MVACQVSICVITEQFSTLQQTIFNELWAREDGNILDHVQKWLLLFTIELHLAFLDGTENCVQTVIFGIIPEPTQ